MTVQLSKLSIEELITLNHSLTLRHDELEKEISCTEDAEILCKLSDENLQILIQNADIVKELCKRGYLNVII